MIVSAFLPSFLAFFFSRSFMNVLDYDDYEEFDKDDFEAELRSESRAKNYNAGMFIEEND